MSNILPRYKQGSLQALEFPQILGLKTKTGGLWKARLYESFQTNRLFRFIADISCVKRVLQCHEVFTRLEGVEDGLFSFELFL